MNKFYTGIGSRETPKNILEMFTGIATTLENKGYILRSGGAAGADTAFALGTKRKQIFLPWKGFNGINQETYIPDKAFDIAEDNHPYWRKLSGPVRALMARNVQQILGSDLNEPSEFVICWTPDGAIKHEERSIITGGTGLAISVASKNSIPVYNVKRTICRDKLNEFLNIQ